MLVLWCFFSGHVNPYAKLLTDLKVDKEDLKYYDLTKLEDARYGKFFFFFHLYKCIMTVGILFCHSIVVTLAYKLLSTRLAQDMNLSYISFSETVAYLPLNTSTTSMLKDFDDSALYEFPFYYICNITLIYGQIAEIFVS